MKNIKALPLKRGFFVITTLLLALALVSIFFMGMKADTSPNTPLGYSASDVSITIEKPKGWLTKETTVKITVESDLKLSKVEAKTTNNGQWQDITDDMTVEISDNCTIYIQVTDNYGRIYTKSRYLEAFDRTNPTIKARIDKTLLRIEAEDDLSGVSAIYIDGERYDDLVNGTIDIRLKELGKEYADISIQAVDKAGNKSSITTLKNPNYKEKAAEVSATQASTTAEPPAGSGSTPAETSGTATGTNTTSPTSSQGASTTSTTSAAANGGGTSSENSSSSSGGDSSEAPLFGTFEDTHKQFMSIVTKDGAVYYLIIDHDKESENVYFLSEVTNAELASFTPQGESITEDEEYPEFIGEQPKEEEIGFIPEGQTLDDTPKTEVSTDDTDTSQNENEVPSEPDSGGSTGTYILMVIAILGVGGAGYYFKIYKPKKELENSDDLDDFTFAEDEDDYVFADEDLDKDELDDSDGVVFEE